MDRLQDEGWQARILLSTGLSASTTATLWAGYGASSASSGTSWDIDTRYSVMRFYRPSTAKSHGTVLGASLNWQYLPRLPVQVGYEYLAVTRPRARHRKGRMAASADLIPSFSERGYGLANERTADNHTLFGSVTWWITPSVYASAGGNLVQRPVHRRHSSLQQPAEQQA